MYEVSRKDYIETLKSKMHNGLVKIITGVRRCGKSYLLFTLFRRHLQESGIQLEVDFVANMGSNRFYIQSAYELPTIEKEKQEKRSLLNIDDSFKKIVIQRNPVLPWYDDDGIFHLGLMDFLLDSSSV